MLRDEHCDALARTVRRLTEHDINERITEGLVCVAVLQGLYLCVLQLPFGAEFVLVLVIIALLVTLKLFDGLVLLRECRLSRWGRGR